MRLVNLVIAASAFLSAIGTVNIFFLWALHSSWWRLKTIRLLAFLMPFLAVVSTILWALGHLNGWRQVTNIAAVTTPTMFILELSLLASLPFSGIVHSIISVIDRAKRRRSGLLYSEGRRRFIKLAAAVFPAVAIPSGLSGVAESYAPIKVPVKKIPITDLPAALQGFKIAHLSDLHLGYYVHLDHLRSSVEKIKLFQPDLALVTGDISDDLNILPQAIEIINSLSPRYGIYACVGNHEYYRGIVEVLKIFAKAPFPC